MNRAPSSTSRTAQSKHKSHFPGQPSIPVDNSLDSSSVGATYFEPTSCPPFISYYGGHPFIPPRVSSYSTPHSGNAPFNRDGAVGVMGNEVSQQQNSQTIKAAGDGASNLTTTDRTDRGAAKPMSNLTVLLSQQQQHCSVPDSATQSSNSGEGREYYTATRGGPESNANRRQHRLSSSSSSMLVIDEADSACGPSPKTSSKQLGSSAPSELLFRRMMQSKAESGVGMSRQNSSGAVRAESGPPVIIPPIIAPEKVRRCLSSKELGTLAPPSGSPYAYMLNKMEQLESSMRQRWQAKREFERVAVPEFSDESEYSSTSSRRRERTNESRNRRKAQHTQAVIDELCEVVADLFVAESKLLNPSSYGVQPEIQDSYSSRYQREQVLSSVHNFVSMLPIRYALGVETPSEVLLHMRLMAVARANPTKAAVHIHNLADDDVEHFRRACVVVAPTQQQQHKLQSGSSSNSQKSLRRVTISCNDAVGLLEYITRWLSTGGSRVLDADVMLSRDSIVLDRFVVEMNGRLRLDTLSNLIESFLRESAARESDNSIPAKSPSPSLPSAEPSGPLYLPPGEPKETMTPRNIKAEMESAVPLSEVLASSNQLDRLGPVFPKLRRLHSLPSTTTSVDTSLHSTPGLPNIQLAMRNVPELESPPVSSVIVHETKEVPDLKQKGQEQEQGPNSQRRRQLVNRKAMSDLDDFGKDDEAEEHSLDYLVVPGSDLHPGVATTAAGESRMIPLIPFEELMLIETIGTGRVSTIYRAAWQHSRKDIPSVAPSVQMVALKVAMVDSVSGDTSHVDELRREADIAARLQHPNICDLVGVAADSECFCLAYDYCDGGSLLSLLTDPTRYYEYLPIAMDIANGMAYLHSRNVIHRDLKPSNILLTRDHRAKIADFGMSVAYSGQELTAETGTYRYMAPEVIRHESYSSNADVYSFGLCLWQLITREIPFATMTPIQAAYAVANGRRPDIPPTTPRRLQEIMMACWDEDSHRRPSFTYIAMALADYARMAFSPANVGALTLQIANETLANVEGNSTVNVDFSTPVGMEAGGRNFLESTYHLSDSHHSGVGLEIE